MLRLLMELCLESMYKNFVIDMTLCKRLLACKRKEYSEIFFQVR